MGVKDEFWLRFWGVRGSVPCPGPDTLRYGGNTACVEVMCGADRLIFDAGTGLRALGASLNGQQGLSGHIFLTHTHIDHINGFPFFRPAYSAQNSFELWAGHLGGKTGALQAVLADLMRAPIFPVPLDIMHACIAFHDFAAGVVIEPVPGVSLRTAPLNHPNGATGYRVDHAGRSFCYVTDTEHRAGELDQNILELIEGSETLIYDATYTDAEYPILPRLGALDLERGRAAVRGGGRQAADRVPPRPGPQRRRSRPHRRGARPRPARLAGGAGGHGPAFLTCRCPGRRISRHRHARGRRRRLWMGLATLLGGRPRGFFIPHRYADRVAPCDYPALAALLAAHDEAFDRVLAEVESLGPALERLGGPPPAPRFDQGWFAPLDACVAYAMVRARRPRRIVEVGSGHSTRFLARAIADQALSTTLVCIDPAPARLAAWPAGLLAEEHGAGGT